ncbi:hypothetical protein [Streptomyces sp. NPDC059881]|uniref:hypothetical protein n=1 Tax=Streptomyces sp. NPDC059881 TaxID=3346986 RepID=UPI0036638C5F
MLTLTEVADDPLLLTRRLALNDGSEVVFRPLTTADDRRLAGFFAGLSPESRRLSTFDGYDLATAQDLCDAIARYGAVGIRLTATDCRFGSTLADDYQGQGVGSMLSIVLIACGICGSAQDARHSPAAFAPWDDPAKNGRVPAIRLRQAAHSRCAARRTG